jgi:hypothetical protein
VLDQELRVASDPAPLRDGRLGVDADPHGRLLYGRDPVLQDPR